jgi:hypothetical protein
MENLDVAIFIERFMYREGLKSGETSVAELVKKLLEEDE